VATRIDLSTYASIKLFKVAGIELHIHRDKQHFLRGNGQIMTALLNLTIKIIKRFNLHLTSEDITTLCQHMQLTTHDEPRIISTGSSELQLMDIDDDINGDDIVDINMTDSMAHNAIAISTHTTSSYMAPINSRNTQLPSIQSQLAFAKKNNQQIKLSNITCPTSTNPHVLTDNGRHLIFRLPAVKYTAEQELRYNLRLVFPKRQILQEICRFRERAFANIAINNIHHSQVELLQESLDFMVESIDPNAARDRRLTLSKLLAKYASHEWNPIIAYLHLTTALKCLRLNMTNSSQLLRHIDNGDNNLNKSIIVVTMYQQYALICIEIGDRYRNCNNGLVCSKDDVLEYYQKSLAIYNCLGNETAMIAISTKIEKAKMLCNSNCAITGHKRELSTMNM